MGLRGEDHAAAMAFCRELELKAGAGALPPPAFPSFAGGAYGLGGVGTDASGLGSWFSHFLPGAAVDFAADAGDLWRNPAVAACQGWIGDNFNEPTLEVVAKDPKTGEEVADHGHDFLKLVDTPNPDYDWDALCFASTISFTCSGDAYWLKCRAPTGRTMQLYWAPWWEIEPVWDPGNKRQFIDHYVHVVDGERIPVRREAVVHFRRGLNPINVRAGLPQLEPVLREIVADNAASSYVASILKNHGIPTVVLFPEDDQTTFDDDEQRSIKKLWTESASGPNVGKPLVSSVRLKIQELTYSPDKMALDKIRQIPEARICAAMRLDPMVVGLASGREHRTYSNLAVAERMAYRNCLIPLQKLFAKTITRQLLPSAGGKPGQRVRWNYDRVEALQEEAKAKSDRIVQQFRAKLIRRNEGRRALGWQPDPGPEGEQYATGNDAQGVAPGEDATKKLDSGQES